MRLATIASIAVLAGSTAALTQIARTPVEQKDAPNTASTPGNDADESNTTAQNAVADGDEAAGNDTGTPGNVKTERAAPPR